MVFVFRSIGTTRNITCFSQLLRLPIATYSKKAAAAVKTSPSLPKERDIAASKSGQPKVISPRLTSIHDIEKPCVDENEFIVRKDGGVRKEPEWRYMELELDKLKKHCLMLSKIRLTSLVVVTTMAGYILAPGSFDTYTFVACSVGTGLVSATANAINQFFEVPFDAQMSRTKNRVLVRCHLTPAHAVTFATISGICGLSLLYSEVNGLTAALGATNLVLYTLIYTPMKRVSILNTWIGSIVGAIPPLMGWTACVGDIALPGAWIMSGMLYAWQFPHFNALSWNLRPDYSRAGYRMMAVTDPKLCRKTALRYTAILTVLCYLAPMFDVTNWWFAVESTPLNACFLYFARNFYKHSDSGSSRKLFRFSLIHLPTLMILLLINKKHWFSENTQKDTLINEEKKNDLYSLLTKLIGTTTWTV
ncbi:cytochrome c oxidase assembly factor 10 [Megalopta genalis]|uniref:cytochrome c oxidase assembly factor 10 n=1 Tax=Megalopta genalis TaxID=115081 RepID=UPI003FD4C87C